MPFFAQKHHALQERKICTAQLASRLRAQFGHQLVQGGHEIMIAHTVDDKNVFALGLLEQIEQLAVAIAGVDRDQHRADTCRGEHQFYPIRHVGRPHGDLFAGRDATGDFVHAPGEVAPGTADALVEIHQSVPFGTAGHGFVEYLTQGTGLQGNIVHKKPGKTPEGG